MGMCVPLPELRALFYLFILLSLSLSLSIRTRTRPGDPALCWRDKTGGFCWQGPWAMADRQVAWAGLG